uniref:ZP domain-containing protein n=1 Tax=Cyprinus carpio TaxID=7962 RepID=A0A8C1LU47_CYPCA
MMSSAVVLNLLLLVSIASAGHHYGGSVTFSPKGTNADGSMSVEFRFKRTYDWCDYSWWSCASGDCGYESSSQHGQIDRSSNGRSAYTNSWCQAETVVTRNIHGNTPFDLQDNSCCWVPTLNGVDSWFLQAHVDLGIRGDTNQPNRSPVTTTLQLLRVPQNCPRTYRLMAYDPDGDQVICRYGDQQHVECATCNQPSGFHLDQHACTLDYNYAYTTGVYGFELIVEDFPRKHTTLAYTDGSSSYRCALSGGRHQTSISMTPYPSWYYQSTTTGPWWQQTTSALPWWGWWQQQQQSTTTPPTTTPWWWWYQQQQQSTTTAPTSPSWWGWWQQQQQSTTTPPTTTPWWWWYHQQQQTTTTPPTTTPWWWWYHQQQQSTTTPPTTTPWGWWYQQQQQSTTTPPTTTPWWWWYHQQQQSTTTPPTTPSWWGWWQQQQQSTTTPPTTTPWWWWQHQQTTSPPPMAQWWWWLQTTTTTTTTQPPQEYTTSMTSHQRSYEPFSKLPLQFSVLVDSAAPSCTEGYYIPLFVSPTPHNGDEIQATPLREVEIRVKAAAAYSTVTDVIISGPLNITKHALSTGEYAIRWTPTRSDLGDHFPVCFIAESMSGNSVYQSEMRCVIINVGRQTVDANVICSATNMVVEIEQLHSVGLHKDYLRLNDPACTLDSNGTHVVANISLNACGTMIEEDEEYIIFKNEIFSTDDPNSIITRKHEVEIEFSCRYEKKNNISLEFTARKHITTITEKGFGTLTYSFGLFRTANFYTEIDVTAYPAEYELGEMIYMQIESQSTINNTELFVESCVATPYNDPNYQTSYTIIQNGCILDETVEFYTSHQPMVRFGLQAFQFIGMHEQVFITCSVILCEANNPNTRCSQGCVNSTVTPPSHHHHKREAPIQTSSHLVAQGPLRLKRSIEHEVSSTVLNLNLVFIAGCLLAAVGMVCGVLIYRTRRSDVKYQPLKSDDI